MAHKSFKKVTLVVCLFILNIVLFHSALSVKANNIPSNVFYPNGLNYIDANNIIYRPGTDEYSCRIETVSEIKVKPGVKYAFYFRYEDDGMINEFVVTGYDIDGKLVDSIETTIFDNCNNRKFTVPTTVEYIKFQASISKNSSSTINLADIASNYFLLEYDALKDFYLYSDEELEYKGASYGNYTYVEGTTKHITYMSDPITNDELKNMIVAYDDYDGDITNEIEEINSEYLPENKAGKYEVEYYVSDSAGNENTMVLSVLIVDDVDPVFSGESTYVTNQLTPLLVSDITNALTVEDNNDGDITSEIELYTDGYTGNEDTPGEYEIVYFVEDSAGNLVFYTVDVIVEYIDDEAPVFGGVLYYTIKNTESISLETIKSNITVSDNIDTNLKDKVEVIYEDLTMNMGKIGKYTVRLQVQDTIGNRTTVDVVVQIIDAKAPIFMIATKNVYLDVKDNEVDTDEIIRYLKVTNNVAEDTECKVLYDEYTENKNTPGKYQVVYQTGDTETRVLVNVVTDLYEIEDTQTIFEKIILFFKNLFSIIAEFFKRLFS